MLPMTGCCACNRALINVLPITSQEDKEYVHWYDLGKVSMCRGV